MKKIIILLSFTISSACSFAQAITNAVKGTIVQDITPANTFTVYGKSNVALTNLHILNINISVSIVDPGVGNRPTLSVLTNFIPDVAWTPLAPYAEGGRWHYDFIANNNSSAAGINTITWAANTSNKIVTITSSTATNFLTTQLDNWDAPNGGVTGQSFWYFELIQAGGGDITAQTNIFYGSVGVTNSAGGVASGTSFVPFQPTGVLPIKFNEFTVTKKANDGILNWSVENETSITAAYEVERSFNGVDFKKFETVTPQNNSSSSNDYTLTDFNLNSLKSSGVIYYRIKQLDQDGKFVYSTIKSLVIDPSKFVITVSPNPVKDLTTFRFTLEKEETISILLVDANGKQIQQFQVKGVKGLNNKIINMANLANGSYQLLIKTSTEIKSVSIVKIN